MSRKQQQCPRCGSADIEQTTQGLLWTPDPPEWDFLAWGAHGGRYPERVRRVAELVIASGRPAFALLGQTKNGQPRHPLMAGYDTPLVPVDEWLTEVTRG